MFLDQPATLTEEDLRQYARLGLSSEPFQDVHYYAPLKADGVNLNSLRTNEALSANTEPLVWGLREVLDYAEVVLNRDDIDAKADAFIDFLGERVVGREDVDEMLRRKPFQVQSFADLDEFFRAIFDFMEAMGRGSEVWRTHHVATIRKVRNRLSNISTRSKGLVTDDGVSNDLPWGRFDDRSVHVIDVAGLDPLAQDLVFARVVSKLREHLERRDLGVDHVVVFVDELNKYAPADRPDTYVRKMLLDLSERGRYLGLVLFDQQFRLKSSAASWATRVPASTAAWIPTSSPCRHMVRFHQRRRSSSPPYQRASLCFRYTLTSPNPFSSNFPAPQC